MISAKKLFPPKAEKQEANVGEVPERACIHLLFLGKLSWRQQIVRLPKYKQRRLYAGLAFADFLLTQVLAVYAVFDAQSLFVFWLLGNAALLIFLLRHRAENVYFLSTLVSLSLALLLAGACSYWNYNLYFERVVFADTGASYRNLVPTTPAESVLDASKLQFSHESIVETTRGVGYRYLGSMYCVAPIVEKDATYSGKVSFWAVGVNCCDSVGDFYCDDAIDQTSHKAAVVMQRKAPFFVPKISEIYALAQLKAEGEFGLPHEAEPIYLRWMRDPGLLRTHYVSSSVAFLFASSAVAGAVLYLTAAYLVLMQISAVSKPGLSKSFLPGEYGAFGTQ
ncbi:unnamed protein product [Amoebophrya sp. A25]|nr:unnamed protein product [Amoebophrya sp. A25]|eukprot:GSA25T00000346001.1